MTTIARESLKDIIFPTLEPDALASKLLVGARVHSALTDFVGLTLSEAVALVSAETNAADNVKLVDSFEDDAHEAIVLCGDIAGESTYQLLFATYSDDGFITELKSFFKFMYPFTLVRDAVRAAVVETPAEAWAVPRLAPDSGETHDNVGSFPYAPDLEFQSPVLKKGASPEPLASRVLGQASSVYGSRNWSDLTLARDNKRLRFFNVDIAGQPLELANVLTFSGNAMSRIVASARPWVGSLALYSRVKARIGDELGPEYFWPAQQSYDDYL
jgi:hypothetical protein